MTPDERLALQRLAAIPRGIAKTFMLAHAGIAVTRSALVDARSKMIDRCYNPNSNAYELRGALGLPSATVGALVRMENLASTAFSKIMRAKPSQKHSIDRWPNPSGNYEPGNFPVGH